jgi:hypothetical protein
MNLLLKLTNIGDNKRRMFQTHTYEYVPSIDVVFLSFFDYKFRDIVMMWQKLIEHFNFNLFNLFVS